MESINLEQNKINTAGANKASLSPKEFFLSLGILIAFVTYITTSIVIFFNILDKIFPDLAMSPTPQFLTISSLSVPLSIALVFFPVLCVLVYYTNKYYSVNPNRLDSKFRKWIMYLVLFVSSVTIIIDLVVTIRYFLNGDITSRFVFKSMIVFVFAILSALYFNASSKKTKSTTITITSIIFCIVFVVSVVLPFMVFGSPATARKISLDNATSGNLSQFENEVVNYYSNYKKLPATKTELLSNSYMPNGTADKITYSKLDDKTFSLCADFIESNQGEVGYYGNPYQTVPVGVNKSYFIHEKGNVCFDRQIAQQFIDQVKVVR